MVKGLIHAIEALVGDTVTIELKNSSVVTGTLASVDQTMTCHLSGAKVVPRSGEPELHDELTVRGMNIRLFLLNETTDIDTLLTKAAAAEKRTHNDNKKKGGNNNNNSRPFGGAKPAPKIAGQIRQRD
jgi:small nuclear ribonucleoprotein D1